MEIAVARSFYFCLQIVSFLLAFVFSELTAHAQKMDSCVAGVFMTKDDFIHDRVSHKIKTAEKGNKFDFNFPADLTLTLKISTPDSTFKFPPGSIYGYRECGKIFRFFPGGRELNAQEDFYEIEEAEKSFVLYSSEFVSGNEIFYSLGLTSPIHRLTFKNLKRDFKDYPDFISEAKKLKHSTDGIPSRSKNGFCIMKFYRELVLK
jgi:hypothetical protein